MKEIIHQNFLAKLIEGGCEGLYISLNKPSPGMDNNTSSGLTWLEIEAKKAASLLYDHHSKKSPIRKGTGVIFI